MDNLSEDVSLLFPPILVINATMRFLFPTRYLAPSPSKRLDSIA